MNNKPTNLFVPVNFLIVDDDEVSIKSIVRAMKSIDIANPTHIARDGLQALEILDQHLDYENVLPPFIVTLDLNMPKMNGIEFLEEIRNHPVYCKLVVFVLTTSDAPDDIDAAYKNNIAGYIVKDNAVESLKDALKMLSDYSSLIVLPELAY